VSFLLTIADIGVCVEVSIPHNALCHQSRIYIYTVLASLS